METLPDVLVSEVLKWLDKTSDRNAVSMVSTRICNIEADRRNYLKVGCGLNPSNEALTLLCTRFPNLTRLEIVYSGWMSNMGKQLDNEGLLILSSHCPKLIDLTLSYCSFINDKGMSNLALCKTLKALKLIFIHGISSNGLLSIASGCKNITALHLNRCTRVNSVEWLEYFGTHGNLDTLFIKNCRGVGQDNLVKLGYGLTTLKRLHLEIDLNYPPSIIHSYEKFQDLTFDNLMELSLVNCSIDFGRPLRHILTACVALESLSLSMCACLDNITITKLSRQSCNLRKISLHIPSDYRFSMDDYPFGLTDDGLMNLARGCSKLEEFELSYTGEFPTLACFTQNALLYLIRTCPLCVLVLKNVSFLDDHAMQAISSAQLLQVLDIERCQDVTDYGITPVVSLSSLKVLKLSKCLGISDEGIQIIASLRKLDCLIVEDCFQISEKGVQGAAKYVSYSQDLNWMH